MGILDDDDLEELEELKKQAEQFHPLELNEANVQAIFSRCLATEEEKKDIALCRYIKLFYKDYTGIDSGDVVFSKEKINQNRNVIRYLFGQLKDSHTPKEDRVFTLQDAARKYDGTVWTEDIEYIFKFLNFSSATGQFRDFTRQGNTIYTDTATNIRPTLSPNDPAFPAWWAAHKAEWETQDKAGQ